MRSPKAGADGPLLVTCAFDDTITVGDVSEAVMDEFCTADWRALAKEYLEGLCSVEEISVRLYELTSATRYEMGQMVLGGVVIRSAFGEFVDYCRGEDIGLAIVSSGLDLYIDPILRQLDLGAIDAFYGRAEVRVDAVSVSYSDPSGASITSGFKESYVRHFRSLGHTVVYVGAGLSDVSPAIAADFVIARSTLRDILVDREVPHRTFETFNDVGSHIEEIRRGAGPEPAPATGSAGTG